MNIPENLMDYSSLCLFFILIAVWIILTYKFGNLKIWKTYYPTILFFWCGNFIYSIVFKNKHLWFFHSHYLNHTFIDFLSTFIIFTCTTILFLSYFPVNFKNKLWYLAGWVLLYSIIEYIFTKLGTIVYFNGWSFTLSVIHNIYQFILLRIHHKKPILAWVLAFIILAMVMKAFKVNIIVP